MSTAGYINLNYDRNILVFIFTATLAVVVLIGFLMLTTSTGSEWLLLPASWWVGGMMVWAFGKYQRNKLNKVT